MFRVIFNNPRSDRLHQWKRCDFEIPSWFICRLIDMLVPRHHRRRKDITGSPRDLFLTTMVIFKNGVTIPFKNVKDRLAHMTVHLCRGAWRDFTNMRFQCLLSSETKISTRITSMTARVDGVAFCVFDQYAIERIIGVRRHESVERSVIVATLKHEDLLHWYYGICLVSCPQPNFRL